MNVKFYPVVTWIYNCYLRLYRMKPLLEYNRGREHLRNREPYLAVSRFDRAESAGHPAGECAAGRWECWMLLEDFERAWCESDLIAKLGQNDKNRLWDGFGFNGKRVIVRGLHGLGDTIQFIRYAQPLRAVAASVVAEVHGELKALLTGLPYLDQVVSWTDGSSKGFDAWDAQIEVMELPRAFRTTLDTIPCHHSYVSVTEEARRESARSLGAPGIYPRVGLVWGASDWNPARSVPVAQLAAALSERQVSFFSFQRGRHASGVEVFRNYSDMHDTAEHSPDIANTAADLMNMDLLITVDTMIAHLAGALGRPVWTMLTFEADWRWMLERNDSPWYPSMKLFRQKKSGDWGNVIDAVAHRLDVLCGDRYLASQRG